MELSSGRGFGGLIRPVVLIFLVVLANAANAGPSQGTKDRCTAYAARAVQQYRLMTSHPECKVDNDPLTWQDSYDNHYNGCLLFPEAMSKLADQKRDNHLQACGAYSSAASAASAASAPAAGPAAPAASAASAAPATPPAATPPAATPSPAASSSMAAAGGNPWATMSAGSGPVPNCSYQDKRIAPGVNPIDGGEGVQIVGGVLSYTSTVGPNKGKRFSYPVVRPQAYTGDPRCVGPAGIGGYWISFSTNPLQDRLFLIYPPGSHAAAIGAVEVRSAQTLPGAK